MRDVQKNSCLSDTYSSGCAALTLAQTTIQPTNRIPRECYSILWVSQQIVSKVSSYKSWGGREYIMLFGRMQRVKHAIVNRSILASSYKYHNHYKLRNSSEEVEDCKEFHAYHPLIIAVLRVACRRFRRKRPACPFHKATGTAAMPRHLPCSRSAHHWQSYQSSRPSCTQA